MVVLFLFLCQWLFPAPPMRQCTVGVIFLNALITTVRFCTDGWMNVHVAFLEYPKVMPAAFIYPYTYYFSVFGNNQLGFVGVPFLFAGIIPALFFLGRSTGLSPTSMSTTDHFTLDFVSAFLPGNVKALL